MGVGSVRNVNPPSSYQIGTIVDDGYGGQGAVIEYNSEQFPFITVDGKPYYYAQTAIRSTRKVIIRSTGCG